MYPYTPVHKKAQFKDNVYSQEPKSYPLNLQTSIYEIKKILNNDADCRISCLLSFCSFFVLGTNVFKLDDLWEGEVVFFWEEEG